MSILFLAWNESPPPACRGGAVTMGNFDGVHLGHAALLAAARAQAEACGGPLVAVTFDPHPHQLLRPDQFQPSLTTPASRAELLAASGADDVVVMRTTTEMLGQPAVEFFNRVVRDGFMARALVEGADFRFGHRREGTVETLGGLCRSAGVAFEVVPPVQVDGLAVSSSRVRGSLLGGDVTEAARLLGRPYRLVGTVETGRRRGRTIGFPTANLGQVQTLIPGHGVYAVTARTDTGSWAAAANIGPNPTFGEQDRKIEVHLLDFDGDLYGRSLTVEFRARLRDVRPFPDVAALTDQLRQDVDEARRMCGQESHTSSPTNQ